MKQEATLTPALEGAARRCHRRHSLRRPPHRQPWTLPAFGPGRSAGDWAWLKTSAHKVALVLNLVPFAGIAFLWFMGVLRDRLGELEDRFLA